MSDFGRSLDAWSVPAGLSLPEMRPLSVPSGDVVVRHLPLDPPWMDGLVRAVTGAGSGLKRRSSRSIAKTLGAVARRFLGPGDPMRARALALLPGTSGLSPEMAVAVLDGMAADWTPERLLSAVTADFPDAGVLDGFRVGTGRRVHAVGPRLCVQIVSGSVPGVGATALLRSLLVKGPTLLKPGRGDVVLPCLLAEALREEDPELGDAIAVVYWPGGAAEAAEDVALRGADVVTVYGGDTAVAAIRSRTPVHARFIGYHNRVSMGIVGRDVLAGSMRARVAGEVACAVSFFDQRGCVSPKVVYVEQGGEASPAEFARDVAAAMEAVEHRLPGGVLDPAEASALHQARGTAELLAASGSGAEIHHGGRYAWTVVYDPSPAFVSSCVGRVIWIKPVGDAADVTSLVAPFGERLQTAAVAGVGPGLVPLARALATVGVTRVTGFGDAPFPSPGWHHDGQGPLAALVRWADLEM